jgi:hypothetical protein
LAVGTGLLAAFTAWLGFEARASAKAAQEAVEASEEPFVIATSTPRLEDMNLRAHEVPTQGHPPPIAIHRALGEGDEGSFLRLRLWNIGQGPAIVMAVQLRGHEGGDLLAELYQHYPVAASGAADIEIRSLGWPAATGDGVLTIDYFRASGLRYRTTSEASIDDPTLECRTYARDRLR